MGFENLSFAEIPVSFQKNLFEKISVLISKGESVQLVGMSGSGSSLITKVLSQNKLVQKKYFSNNTVILRLDGDMLLEQNPLNLLRLLLSLLTTEDISNDPISIFNKIEFEVAKICHNRNLVLVIDHLNFINSQNLKPFYLHLHKLHRSFEPKFTFIFVTSKELSNANDLTNFGNLGRVVVQNILLIPSFGKDDSMWFMRGKEAQINMKLTKKEKEEIFRVSGGFPRTIKRLIESIAKGFKVSELEANPLIDPSLAHYLSELADYENFSIPILEVYKQVKGNERGNEVIGGIKFSRRLTKNEMKVLKALFASKDEVIDRETAIEKVWGERGIAISDHAYDQIIHRLRNKLKTAIPKTDIETVKGRGHLLRTSVN